jgi:hypothetical protein
MNFRADVTFATRTPGAWSAGMILSMMHCPELRISRQPGPFNYFQKLLSMLDGAQTRDADAGNLVFS